MKELPVKGMRYFNWSNCSTYTVITSLDISSKEAASFNTLLSDIDEIYMNEKAIYLTDEVYNRWRYDKMQERDYTYITKYDLNKKAISFVGCNRVYGTLLNQFSMDENNGYFRIATNEGDKYGNNVYILDKQLKQVGKIEGLAKGEDIYSVRFDGNRGYVVTFEQVDPLFVLDLSDVKAPKVLGKLKIPGFSQYLHPIGDNLVVGIGRATEENILRDEQGDERVTGVRATGIKLSLFDVKNPQEPKEINHIILGDSYAYSEALEDHTAVMVDKKRQVLAIPIYLRYDEIKKITDNTKADYLQLIYIPKT